MQAQGVTWSWAPDGTGVLTTTTAALPAIRVDSGPGRSGVKTFFNSIVAAYTGWNDSRNKGELAVLLPAAEAGEEDTYCDAGVIADAVRIMEEICVAIPWQVGDVLLLDNRLAMHARRPFEGKRRILASLIRDYR